MARTRFRALAVGAAATALIGASIVAVPTSASARPAACNVGRVVCVNKSTRELAFVINGRTVLSMDARFGSTRQNTPTREGMFTIYWKDANHVSSLFGSSMPFAMFFSGGQAIHYSSDFARNGYAGASHGCVNTRDYSAMRELFSLAHEGDKVYIHW